MKTSKFLNSYFLFFGIICVSFYYFVFEWDSEPPKSFQESKNTVTQNSFGFITASVGRSDETEYPLAQINRAKDDGLSAKNKEIKETTWQTSTQSVAVNLQNWRNWAESQGGMYQSFTLNSLFTYLKGLPSNQRYSVMEVIALNKQNEFGAALYLSALMTDSFMHNMRPVQGSPEYLEGVVDFGTTGTIHLDTPCTACKDMTLMHLISPAMADVYVRTASSVLSKCGVLDKIDYYLLNSEKQISKAIEVASVFSDPEKHNLNNAQQAKSVCDQFNSMYSTWDGKSYGDLLPN